MSLILIDSFDYYNGTGVNTGMQARWTFSGNGSQSLIAGRFGGQAYRQTGSSSTSSGYGIRGLPVASANVAVGVAFRTPTMHTATSNFLWLNSGASGWMIGLRLTTTGAIEAARYTAYNTFTSLGISAAGKVVANSWHYIELEATIHDTTGAIRVYVDGAEVLNLSNIDTRNGTPTTVDTILLGNNTGGANSGINFDFDDLYVTNTAVRLGESKAEPVRPIADTVDKDFTRSAGTDNYALVDELLADATDYVQASTVGDLDLYEMGDLTTTPATIHAVQLTCFALKTDASSRNIALVADVSGTQAQSADFALAASTGKHDAIMETKPGGGAWDSVAVNALKVGPKVTL